MVSYTFGPPFIPPCCTCGTPLAVGAVIGPLAVRVTWPLDQDMTGRKDEDLDGKL